MAKNDQLVVDHLALYGGMFNPPHIAHIITANQVVHETDVDSVLWMPGGNVPHRESPTIKKHHRKSMLRLVTSRFNGFYYSDYEMNNPDVNYSINTIKYLYKTDTFKFDKLSLIVGSDQLATFKKWKNWKDILKTCHRLYHSNRPDYTPEIDSDVINDINQPLLNLSSTEIRRRIRHDEPIDCMVTTPIQSYINEHNLYQRS
jgi:nicotinate-nucleotide adenylyltransferase